MTISRHCWFSVCVGLPSANAAGARYALILGDDELDRGEAQLKDLTSGEQRSVSLDLIGEAIRA